MDVQWHIAFCNVTYTEYAGLTYREYYASPADMLEAQLTAKAVAEQTLGVGCFITPHIDTPPVAFASYLGVPVVEPADDDELPYIDGRSPVLTRPDDAAKLAPGDPKTTGMMARRWQAWQYYRRHGYPVRFGGHLGAVVTTAHEISSGGILLWLAQDPDGAEDVLDAVTEAELAVAAFDDELCGPTEHGYTGDDFAGLLSPEMFRRYLVPRYARLYRGKTERFMHSELLRAEHLRIAKDLLDITSFHGAGCELLTLEEMHDIMGPEFWTQVTPQELLEESPSQVVERVKRYANCGCRYVQLYPGRNTPRATMEAAIAALERECTGGRVGG